MKEHTEVLKKLFISTLYLSAFTFGGGYVIISLMRTKFVDELHWIEEDEMLDLVAIAQSSPGAIAVNGAIVIGYKLAGWKGILTAVLATIIPPFTIICIVSLFYQAFRENKWIITMLNGMQVGVAAIIINAVFDMGKNALAKSKVRSYLIMIVSFIAAFIFEINVVYIIIATILLASMKIGYSVYKEGK
ncbi:MAG: chromate transporter [Erysipelotrichia bacterium]|nr:chromate transporter [Erysipelotrichia bacterium]NCC54183.1 chromate transporter [Erysipelotrichia bacterium]